MAMSRREVLERIRQARGHLEPIVDAGRLPLSTDVEIDKLLVEMSKIERSLSIRGR